MPPPHQQIFCNARNWLVKSKVFGFFVNITFYKTIYRHDFLK
jgi:hypothetical protein